MDILCVCTYNQTRSVLMAALLGEHLQREGVRARITGAGTRAGGGAPMQSTVDLLARRGIDVRGHRGRPLDEQLVADAQLVITAEQAHVIEIAGQWPSAFPRTFTLPELARRTSAAGARGTDTIEQWVRRLNDGRSAGLDYFDDPTVGEVADPTGRDRNTWSESFASIDELTRRIAEALAR
ncbi:MAG: hypothetical protein RJB61_2095 [Actinomycetota bacterium]